MRSVYQTLNDRLGSASEGRKVYADMMMEHDEQVLRYDDDEFYVFSRGDIFLVAMTNFEGSIMRRITNHPFDEGETVCNIFKPIKDCQKVDKEGVRIVLVDLAAKIYVPQSQLFVSTNLPDQFPN